MNAEITQSEKRAGYSGIFLERSGIDSLQLTRELVAEPTHPLNDEEKQQVYTYEDELLRHQLDTNTTLEDAVCQSLKGHADTPLFFAEAFRQGAVNVNGPSPDFASGQDVYTWLAEAAKNGSLSPEELRRLAKESYEYYSSVMTRALVEGERPSDESIASESILIDPDTFLKVVANTKNARAFLIEERRQLAQENTVDAAKRALNDIYLAKINEKIATQVPMAYNLIEQSQLLGDQETERAVRALIPPSFSRLLDDSEGRQQLFRRLDYIRSGIGYDEAGHASSVSSRVPHFEHSGAELESKGVFSTEQKEAIRHYEVSPEHMVEIFSKVLSRAKLLSQEDPATWDPARTGWASDNLFQVRINPTKSTFAVNPDSGAYLVPSQPRPLYDVIAVGGFHELEHVNQALADQAIGKKIKIAALQSKRVGALREAGANIAERRRTTEIFGEAKPYARTYAAALQALEKGGGIYDAAKAFYDEKCAAFPDANRQKAASEAADRVLRLIRLGGINSEAMAYAEEAIMAEEMVDATPTERSRAVAVTSLDLVDQVRLHQFGLLPESDSAAIDWRDIVLDVVGPDIERALQRS